MVQDVLKKIEFYSVCLLALSIPAMQGPKNMAMGLIILSAIFRRLSEKSVILRKPDWLECVLIMIFASTLISTLVNLSDIPGSARSLTKGVRDVASYLFLFWVMYRNTYTPSQLRILVWFILLGTLVGLSQGIWNWYTGVQQFIEFKHVPSVTVTILYANIVGFLLLGAIIDPQSQFSIKSKWVFLIGILFFIFCMVIMGRRSCSVGFILSFLAMLYFFPKNKKLMACLVIFIIFSALSVFSVSAFSPRFQKIAHTKHFKELIKLLDDQKSKSDHLRIEAWKLGIAQALQGGHLLWGVGPHQFKNIRPENLTLDPHSKFQELNIRFLHPHNMFLNKLCEEGAVGLILFGIFLLTLIRKLLAFIKCYTHEEWISIAALGTFINMISVGMLDSPFYGEIAWLSMILLGMGMARTSSFDTKTVEINKEK